MNYDETGWPMNTPASPNKCRTCARKFAVGTLPHDGVLVCRDCRAEAAVDPDPVLFEQP